MSYEGTGYGEHGSPALVELKKDGNELGASLGSMARLD